MNMPVIFNNPSMLQCYVLKSCRMYGIYTLNADEVEDLAQQLWWEGYRACQRYKKKKGSKCNITAWVWIRMGSFLLFTRESGFGHLYI